MERWSYFRTRVILHKTKKHSIPTKPERYCHNSTRWVTPGNKSGLTLKLQEMQCLKPRLSTFLIGFPDWFVIGTLFDDALGWHRQGHCLRAQSVPNELFRLWAVEARSVHTSHPSERKDRNWGERALIGEGMYLLLEMPAFWFKFSG